jgi:hypothetical protein
VKFVPRPSGVKSSGSGAGPVAGQENDSDNVFCAIGMLLSSCDQEQGSLD